MSAPLFLHEALFKSGCIATPTRVSEVKQIALAPVSFHGTHGISYVEAARECPATTSAAPRDQAQGAGKVDLRCPSLGNLHTPRQETMFGQIRENVPSRFKVLR